MRAEKEGGNLESEKGVRKLESAGKGMKATEIMRPAVRRLALYTAEKKLNERPETRGFALVVAAMYFGAVTNAWLAKGRLYESHQSPGTIVDPAGPSAISADGVWLESEESGQLEPRTDILSENELQAVIDELALYQWRKG